MSSSDSDFIAHINNISSQMNRYFSIFVFLFGTFGNILNMLILSQRSFRKNPCAILFLSSSAANFIAIISGLTSRMLSDWAADLSSTDRIPCKLRAFFLNTARTIGFWLITLATIDRWLSSSTDTRFRQISTLKNTYRGIIIIVVGSTILFSHILYCYEPNLINTPLKCYGITMTCRYLADLSFIFLTNLIPMLLMFIFGLMIVRNLRQSRLRTQPGQLTGHTTVGDANKIQQQNQRSKADANLRLMLLGQVALLFILGLPLGIQKLYATITVNDIVSKRQIAIDNFVYNFFLLLTFVANGLPFYIYTLAGGPIFRREAIKIWLAIRKKVLCR